MRDPIMFLRESGSRIGHPLSNRAKPSILPGRALEGRLPRDLATTRVTTPTEWPSSAPRRAPAPVPAQPAGSGLNPCTVTQHVPWGLWFVLSLHCGDGGTLLWIFTT